MSPVRARATLARNAQAARARDLAIPVGGEGSPVPPSVPLPVRGGTAPRDQRIRPPPDGIDESTPADRTWLEEGRLITKLGDSVLRARGVCVCCLCDSDYGRYGGTTANGPPFPPNLCSSSHACPDCAGAVRFCQEQSRTSSFTLPARNTSKGLARTL